MRKILAGILFLSIIAFLISSCGNPVEVNQTVKSNRQIISKDTNINIERAEIIVWQIFRSTNINFPEVYINAQTNEGFFETFDSVTVLNPRDTLYFLNFEIEWNSPAHVYSLNNVLYTKNGWTTLDLACGRKYEILRLND